MKFIHFEYKNFSEQLKEAEIMIPRFSIPETKCQLKRNVWRETNEEIIYIFAFHNFFGISRRVLLVLVSIYTNDFNDYMLNNKPLLINRVIKLKLSSCLFHQYCLPYRHLTFWNCRMGVQYLGFLKSLRTFFYSKLRYGHTF